MTDADISQHIEELGKIKRQLALVIPLLSEACAFADDMFQTQYNHGDRTLAPVFRAIDNADVIAYYDWLVARFQQTVWEAYKVHPRDDETPQQFMQRVEKLG